MIEILQDLAILFVATATPIFIANRVRDRRYQRKMAEYAYDPNPVHWHAILRRKDFESRWDASLKLSHEEEEALSNMDSVAFLDRKGAIILRDYLRKQTDLDEVGSLKLNYLEESLK